jgi:uncharacterized protein YndB with AHSA1/START domain
LQIEVSHVNGLTRTPRTIINPAVTALLPGLAEEDIALSFRFNADPGRVFYALSIPEYIETWLQAPHGGGLHFVFNSVAQESFRVDLYRGESLQAIVHGLCRVVGANQVRYVWKRTGLSGTTETRVDMKLLCDAAACVVALKHSGFKDANECVWCREMWYQSLERLSRLVERN